MGLKTCKACTKPATRGVYCDFHRKQANDARDELAKRRKEAGLCVKCGKETDENSFAYCTKHMLANQKRRRLSDVKLSGGIRTILNKDRVDKEDLILIKKKLSDVLTASDFQSRIDDTERKVLNLRILSDKSLRKAGNELGLTYEWVRQIETKVANKVKDYIDKKEVEL